MFAYGQNFYERITGIKHRIEVQFHYNNRRVYEVRVDDEFYSTAETRAQAYDEVADIIRSNNWSGICPI